MTEIKKFTKIVIIYYGIAGALFAFLYLVFTDFQLLMWPWPDPVPFWAMGYTMLVLAIASFIALFRKEWEHFKSYFEIMLIWDLGAIFMDIAIVIVITIPEAGVPQMAMNFILLSFNLIIGLFSYIKQRV